MDATSENPSADEQKVSLNSPTDSATDIQKKRSLIKQASNSRDVTALVKLAGSHGGLLDDDLRKNAWPLLLGCEATSVETSNDSSWTALPPHKDEDQVELDVNRAFVYYPNGTPLSYLAMEIPLLMRLQVNQTWILIFRERLFLV